ncbi:hypothetical protein MIND_00131900 [Mycena indigotica]|uniref:Uncharacterized protein n=1 Tax=Mycena indigotica TaxID=2126181 RepID=A0A8H6TCN8_9AGAR|nr:uncharacterized protein MIND_00131900 [Mycena indigotica]KAF7316138.1 hypothetical protein MIND_00131900 [Mycena indigotica]
MSGPTAVTSFSPALHRQLQVVSLVFAGTASVCVWDVLNNLQAEYRMLKKSKFGLASVAYIASRVGSLIYSLGILLFSTYPLQDCAASLHAFEAFYPIATTGSAYLFYARLRAVSGFNRAITFTFALLWLCVLGTSLLIPIVGKAASVNNVCLYTSSDDYSGAAGITILVYDTAVFLTISYQLVGNYGLDVDPTDSARGTACSWDRARWFISGKNLPAFSKTLLTEGQVYYMITVLVNVVAIALVYAPQDLASWHAVSIGGPSWGLSAKEKT